MKPLTRIALLCAVLTAFLCASAYALSDAPSVQVTGKPTVSGAPIRTYHLNGLEEIAVPVQVSADAPANVNLFASFYARNNKYIGMGATSATVDSETSFVIMPVEDAVTGAEVLKMAVTDADFRPLSVSRYSLTDGGGGGGGSSNVSSNYYLKAAASFTSENGGSGAAYLMNAQPTEDTDLSEAYPFSTTFQYQSYDPSFVYYVIFAPDDGSQLSYPRIVQGPASGVARVPVTLRSAPNAIIYRVSTSGALSEANAPSVTMKGIFRGNGGGGSSSGGGGGSSSGGGGYTPPVVTRTTHYLLVRAEVVPAEHGTVFMTDTPPSETTSAPQGVTTNRRALFSREFQSSQTPELTGYAVFLSDEGYTLDADSVSVTAQTGGNIAHSDPAPVTLADGLNAYWISFTARGTTNSSTDPSRTPDVTITAGFQSVPDPVLTYTLNVVIEGEGIVKLNVGGENLTFAASNTITRTIKTSEYIAQYGGNYADYALPVYLVSEPLARPGYRYESVSPAALKDSSRESPVLSLTPDQPLSVTVSFLQERSFGYNLTIIGKGSVTVNFNGENRIYSNETENPKTMNYREVSVAETADVSVSRVTAAEGYIFDSVSINDSNMGLGSSYILSEGMTDIVVTFRKEDAPDGALDHENETPVLSGAVEYAE